MNARINKVKITPTNAPIVFAKKSPHSALLLKYCPCKSSIIPPYITGNKKAKNKSRRKIIFPFFNNTYVVPVTKASPKYIQKWTSLSMPKGKFQVTSGKFDGSIRQDK